MCRGHPPSIDVARDRERERERENGSDLSKRRLIELDLHTARRLDLLVRRLIMRCNSMRCDAMHGYARLGVEQSDGKLRRVGWVSSHQSLAATVWSNEESDGRNIYT